MRDDTHAEFQTDTHRLTVEREGDTVTSSLADMREAADTLLEDESSIAAVLANANVSLIQKGGDMYVQRHDLHAYRERELARRQAGIGEITRLSIAAGLDDVDYSTIEHDQV